MGILHVPVWAWAATIAALAAVLTVDLAVSARRTAPVRLPEAGLWTVAMIMLAVSFGAMIAITAGGTAAGQFYAGWLTEYSLSLDNLFVFALLISASAVPRQYHGRVLLLGIVLALILRGAFISLGAAALHRFGWIEFLFGAFLVFTGGRIALRRHDQPQDPAGNGAVRAVRRLLPVAPSGEGTRLTVRVDGRRMATPMLILIAVIGVTDVLFALDSIPAIFGLTRDPFLVFSANLFALLGLRHLYFLVGGLLGRLTHLTVGLAAVLGFIGVKIIAGALQEAGVARIGPVPVPHIGTGLSLAVIAGVVTAVTVTSLAADRRASRAGTDASPRTVPGDGRWADPPRCPPADGPWAADPPRTLPADRRRPDN